MFSVTRRKRKNLFKSAFALLASGVLLLGGSVFSACADDAQHHEGLLCDVYSDYFKIGAATSSGSLKYEEDVLTNFNSITSTYEMKWGALEPQSGKYTYGGADRLMQWASEQDVSVRGHCLVWYRNVPDWVTEAAVDKQTALDLIDSHIRKTMTHFGDDVIYCWDVVNEALVDDPTEEQLASGEFYRSRENDPDRFGDGHTTKRYDFYGVCGRDYIWRSFSTADKVCREYGYDDMQLFYNDWFMHIPNKRDACVQMVKDMQADGVRIDGIGMQGHYWLSDYKEDKDAFVKNIEDAIKAYTGLGLDVHLTELEVIVGKSLFGKEKEQAELYGKIFDICRKYSTPWKEGAGTVTSVTLWGAVDTSEKKNYIFKSNHRPKKAYYEITDFI